MRHPKASPFDWLRAEKLSSFRHNMTASAQLRRERAAMVASVEMRELQLKAQNEINQTVEKDRRRRMIERGTSW